VIAGSSVGVSPASSGSSPASRRSDPLALNDRPLPPTLGSAFPPAIVLSTKPGDEGGSASGDTARRAREKAEAELAELQTRIAPLENETNQLTRQFWVTKEKVVAEKYDLSASRYRQIEQEEVFYEKPAVTLERMRQLEDAAERDRVALG